MATRTAVYRVAFDKIEALGYEAEKTAADGVAEIHEALEAGMVDKTDKTITLAWYRNLSKWHGIVRETEMWRHGGDLRFFCLDRPDNGADIAIAAETASATITLVPGLRWKWKMAPRSFEFWPDRKPTSFSTPPVP